MGESAACACKAEKVSARNVGTVHERALVRTVRRKNSRRVWRVISFFMIRLPGIRGCTLRAGWHRECRFHQKCFSNRDMDGRLVLFFPKGPPGATLFGARK